MQKQLLIEYLKMVSEKVGKSKKKLEDPNYV